MTQGLIQTLLVRFPLAYFMSIQPNASLTKIGLAAPVATTVGIFLNIGFFIYLNRAEQRKSIPVTYTHLIRIPEQLSMIGFDNLQFARACKPKLTIVAQPTDGIAKEVAKVMLNHLENTGEASGELFSEKLETEIIAGKSVRVFA